MDTILVLICNPARPALTPERLAAVSAALKDKGAVSAALGDDTGDAKILNDGVAAEFAITGAPAIKEAVASAIGEAPIDVCLVPASHRRKTLFVADMDSTIIEQECIDELADFVGRRDEIAAITERAMRGELDFDGALKERVVMLKGLGPDSLETAFRERITLTPGAETLLATLRKNGAFTALVSGGFTYFTERVAARAGFHVNQANQLIIDADGALTGAVKEPILGRAAKEDALRGFAAEREIDLADAMAVGDGANDLAMLGAAGLGVAFRAKPAVAAAADVAINHGDLTALLYLQGIAAADFA